MKISTLLLYLIGNRQAILALATNRSALWIGMLFVLSAGFAREYDGQDLLHEPWYLLFPFAASLTASFVLFVVACFPVFFYRPGGRPPPFFTAYRSFLTLFWLTAPLAWLYAVPYERFLSPAGAADANLWTLGLVAAWRVALMVRVVSVLTGRDTASCVYLVMAFADVVAMSAIALMPRPVVGFMGGIVRLTESETVVANVTANVAFFGWVSAPVWIIGALKAFSQLQPAVWQIPREPTIAAPSGRCGWLLAVAALAIWLPILPRTQAEQQLRTQVERALKSGRIAEGLDVLSAHRQSDFPPQWEPPPRIGYGEQLPDLLDGVELILIRKDAAWVRECYLDKFRRFLRNHYRMYSASSSGNTRLIHILKQIPPQELTAEDERNLKTLLELVEREAQPKP